MTRPSDKYGDETCAMRKVNGDPCGGPALKGERFCHYHKMMGATPVHFDNQNIPSTHVYLPPLGDAASIQAAISEVCELMLHRRIEPKEASALFYAMQVASQNLGPLAGTSNGSKTRTATADTPGHETSNSAPLPPGTIQACAQQAPRRPRGRPRKPVPQLAQAK